MGNSAQNPRVSGSDSVLSRATLLQSVRRLDRVREKVESSVRADKFTHPTTQENRGVRKKMLNVDGEVSLSPC